MSKNTAKLDVIYEMQKTIDLLKSREKFYLDTLENLPEQVLSIGVSHKQLYRSLADAYNESYMLLQDIIKRAEENERN